MNLIRIYGKYTIYREREKEKMNECGDKNDERNLICVNGKKCAEKKMRILLMWIIFNDSRQKITPNTY